MSLKKGSKYNYVVLLYEYYVKETYTRLNTTLSKCPATANISDNDNDDAIVLAIYTINDTIRAMQN